MIDELDTLKEGIFEYKIILTLEGVLFCEGALIRYFFIDFERNFWIQFFDNIDIAIFAKRESIIEFRRWDTQRTEYLLYPS